MIAVLPPNVAEKIAAGEVVERPSSVVKELVENAIDAKATSITVEIKNGGISFIRVTDNGIGMSADDAQIAFIRHATSKITTEEDLEGIASLGFRGEALYAISAVSHIELQTKEKHAENGTQVSISAGTKSDAFSAPTSDGTTIVVKDLFYNTPARMKFLKSDKAEGAFIADTLERIALAHPEIAFRLISEGTAKLNTNGNGDLQQVVYAIYGSEYASNIETLNYTYQNAKITGVLGNSTTFRSNRNFQTVFVNGRYVKAPMVANAVEEAHKTHLMSGKHPFFVINIELPFNEVDINVHPAKTQVKFANEQAIYQAVYWAAKSALDSEEPRLSKEPVKVSSWTLPVSAPSQTSRSMAQISFPISAAPNNALGNASAPTTNPILVHNSKHEENSKSSSETTPENTPEYVLIGRALGTYIIIQQNDEIILIDQHAAHERQIYEDLLAKQTIVSQSLMSGITVTLTKPEMENIISNQSAFETLGFEIDQFGENSVIVRATPLDLPIDTMKNTLLEIAGKLEAGAVDLTSDARENALHTIACKSAIKANQHLSSEEMRELIDWVLSQKGNQTCPHGRPLTAKITKYELEKMFKRVV